MLSFIRWLYLLDTTAVDKNGVAHAWINAGPNGQVWLWNAVDFRMPVDLYDSTGTISGFFVMGDVNGDGRADVAFVHFDTSVIDIYIQQGELGTSGWGWQSCLNKGILDFSSATSLFLQDIDGDGQ